MNKTDALTGALVADAASMGLHWMYDVEHIQTLAAGGDLLFRPADANAFEGRRAAFVHHGKRAGELSHYGESARIVHELLSHDEYSCDAHRTVFMDTFGPCGSYTGYADRPTKALVVRILTEGENLVEPSGMDDDQMPAFCVLPGIIANNASTETALQAAQVISIHADVKAGIETVCALAHLLIQGKRLTDALQEAADQRDDSLGEQLRKALKLPDYQPIDVGEKFGRACHAGDALPVVWHLLRHAEDFETTVRDNVRCGGDSCGRSMVLGAIAGLVFGVPDAMKRKLSRGVLPFIA